MNRQGDQMPTDDSRLRHLPEPAELHAQLSQHHPLDWGSRIPSTAEIAAQYGTRATARSLEALRSSAQTEPRVTRDVLTAVPPGSEAYQLESRVKSPASLARKFRDWEDKDRRFRPDDILRYTVVTRLPDDLVPTTQAAVEALHAAGWRVSFAVNSYTEGSRYKGLHAGMVTPEGDRVELQFHSVESMKVKEATTPAYEVERSADATPDERAAARAFCVSQSASLATPAGLATLSSLGGTRVAVRNYSDSRAQTAGAVPQPRESPVVHPQARSGPEAQRNEGITR